MHPELFNIGVFHIKTYGFCMAVGFLLCWKLIEKLSPRKDIANLLMYLMVGGVVGSRIAYVIEHWQAEFAMHPMSIIRVDQGGLVFYGGLILSILIFFGWCFFKKEKPLALADLFCTVLPLGHACGRLGCFFYGCCWGRLSDSSLAVCFPRHAPAWYAQLHEGFIPASALKSLPVLPTQLFEAGALLLLFAILLTVYIKFRRYTAGIYLIGYAVIRFGIEFLRGDPRAVISGLSIGQTISLGMIVLGATFIYLSYESVRHHR